MDRAKFLLGLKRSAVRLTAFTPPGFTEPIYLRPLSMADIKAVITKPDEPKEVRDRLTNDPLYIERGIARIVRGADGNLLFDEKDNAQMDELKSVMDNNSHNVSRLIHEAHEALQLPDKSEADPKGN